MVKTFSSVIYTNVGGETIKLSLRSKTEEPLLSDRLYRTQIECKASKNLKIEWKCKKSEFCMDIQTICYDIPVEILHVQKKSSGGVI